MKLFKKKEERNLYILMLKLKQMRTFSALNKAEDEKRQLIGERGGDD